MPVVEPAWDVLVALCGILAAIAGLLGRLPAQNIAAVFVLASVFGAAFEWFLGKTGLWMPFFWFFALVSAREFLIWVAGGIKDRRLDGILLILWTGILAAAFLGGIGELSGQLADGWKSMLRLALSVPALWIVLAISTPWLISKKPVDFGPNFFLSMTWLALNMLLVTIAIVKNKCGQAGMAAVVNGLTVAVAILWRRNRNS